MKEIRAILRMAKELISSDSVTLSSEGDNYIISGPYERMSLIISRLKQKGWKYSDKNASMWRPKAHVMPHAFKYAMTLVDEANDRKPLGNGITKQNRDKLQGYINFIDKAMKKDPNCWPVAIYKLRQKIYNMGGFDGITNDEAEVFIKALEDTGLI